MAGVRFIPGAGPALLGFDGAELADLTVPLADLSPALARRVRARIDPERPLAGLLAVADELPRRDLRADVLEAVATLRRGDPGLPALARRVGTSERSLRRWFSATVGLSPRTLGRVLRFQRALDAIRSGRPLAEVAGTCGYADQAHLARGHVRSRARRPASCVAGTFKTAGPAPGEAAVGRAP